VASKKDLIDAQVFSRRRLLTAFTSGAVGTKEMEPVKPLRPVIVGLALTVLIVIGGLFYGFLSPGIPNDWQDNRLVIAKDTGARYVSSGGVLYPVLNTASARLMIPAGQFAVVNTSSGQLSKIEIGPAMGIVGAPDQLPSTKSLLNTGWASCLDDDGAPTVTIAKTPPARATSTAVVVRSSTGDVYVVAGKHHYLVAPGSQDAVLRALGLGGAAIIDVDDRWLNLFMLGTPLGPIVVADDGRPVPGTSLTTGQVIHQTGDPADRRYLVLEDGLAEISPLAYQLYLQGTGMRMGEAREVSPADVQALKNVTNTYQATDWPRTTPERLTDARPCALSGVDTLGTATTTLAATTRPVQNSPVVVDRGAGAVVWAQGRGDEAAGSAYVIDATGTAFPVNLADDALKRLGYDLDEVGFIDAGWIDLLQVGVTLSVAAASQPSTGTSPSPAP